MILMELGLEAMEVVVRDKEIISDDEYEEFLLFIDEYKRKKKEKEENSLIMWIYNKLVSKE